jgi:hypothetical protein
MGTGSLVMIKLRTFIFLSSVKSLVYHFKLFFGIFLLVANTAVFAEPIIIMGRTVIDKPTTYKNVQLDLSNGYFQVVNNASLDIENCIIIGTISSKNMHLIELVSGDLILKNNSVGISSVGIPQNPENPSIFDVINVAHGHVTIMGNKFSVDTPYTVGLLTTNGAYTVGFKISGNEVRNFHGGFLLKNSHEAYIDHNKFSNVSISNILIVDGSNALFEKNDILFPGNNNVGDGIDIMDSDNITLNQNYISSGSCYSVIILRGKNITFNRNQIVGGITYAISIKSSIGSSDLHHAYLLRMMSDPAIRKMTRNSNTNIKIINNYLAQNRYGLTAANVDGLVVEKNVFIQKFLSDSNRRFWTNNNILLKNTVNVTWSGNLYKEAYAQDDSGNNSELSKFVEFPLTGGVNL